MAVVPTERALPEYQRRVGVMLSEIIMRDVAIALLEEQLAAAQQEAASLRAQLQVPDAVREATGQDTLSAVNP